MNNFNKKDKIETIELDDQKRDYLSNYFKKKISLFIIAVVNNKVTECREEGALLKTIFNSNDEPICSQLIDQILLNILEVGDQHEIENDLFELADRSDIFLAKLIP